MASTEYPATGTPIERAVAELRTTVAVRERSGQLAARARRGESAWFDVDDDAGPRAAAQAVARATRARYPCLHIPYHSRWRHFEAGGIDRKARLDALLQDLSAAGRAHALIDLVMVSVLLDAGAGPDWKYTEPGTGQVHTRSEGLAVASFHAFLSGLFSSDRLRPLQADAEGLRRLSTARLAEALQVADGNPMVGLEGRAILLRQLGEALGENPGVYGDPGRPGGLFDALVAHSGGEVPPTASVAAHELLSHLLMTLSGIWPANNRLHGVALGDAWCHAAVRGEGESDGWIPFHKLSQWLTYSLVEPIEWAGVPVRDLHHLTGLPEYRNGGLLLDSGWLRLRDASAATQLWRPGDEIIVEWRALTVTLLDELAHGVREELRVPESRLPLACVLEGGTWAAGRELAQQRRQGLPPLRVDSDGTVF